MRAGAWSDRMPGDADFERLFDLAPAALLAVDLDATLRLFNARSERLFGFGRDELLGGAADRLAPSGHRQSLRRALLSPLGPLPPPRTRTSVCRRKDGALLVLEFEPRLVEVGDGSIVLVSVVDVSGRAADEARDRSATEEKNLLVSEVHHRVKNNLQVICSLLELQKARVSDPRLVDILSDSYARVVSMALVHQAICQAPDLARVDFRYFLDMLVSRLRELHGDIGGGRAFELDAIDMDLTMERAMPCGLAANELLANALRASVRADAGLAVSLSAPTPGSGRLTVRCTGAGGPYRHREESEFSLRLIELLVAQSRGHLRTDEHAGGSWEFTFPLHTDPER